MATSKEGRPVFVYNRLRVNLLGNHDGLSDFFFEQYSAVQCSGEESSVVKLVCASNKLGEKIIAKL